jgi:spore coat polysaccharide biosynthesis protein SpsF
VLVGEGLSELLDLAIVGSGGRGLALVGHRRAIDLGVARMPTDGDTASSGAENSGRGAVYRLPSAGRAVVYRAGMRPATPVVAIIQARTGSTRLPGKVLLPLGGQPLLARVVERVGRTRQVDEVVVATTTMASDDPIVDLGAEHGWTVTRGSENDLLDRYVQTARTTGAATVVRITSDCPLIDPEVIQIVLDAFAEDGADYAANVIPRRSWPMGQETEVVRADVLEAAWRDDHDPAWREHVTPFVYRHPERFRRLWDASSGPEAGWREILDVVQAHPDWAELNRDIVQKKVPLTSSLNHG